MSNESYTFFDASNNKWVWDPILEKLFCYNDNQVSARYFSVPSLKEAICFVEKHGYMTEDEKKRITYTGTEDVVLENPNDKHDIKIDYRGNMLINIFQLIDELPDEYKQELLNEGGWMSFYTKAMAEDIINEFSSSNYNSQIHEFRTMLLNSDVMPEIIRNWVKAVIREKDTAIDYQEYWRQAYSDIYHWAHANFENVTLPSLPERNYNRPYPKELIEKAMKEVEEMAVDWDSVSEKG